MRPTSKKSSSRLTVAIDIMESLSNFNFVLDVINQIDPEQRNRKISNKLALLEIEEVLRSGTQWRKMKPNVGSCWSYFRRFSKWRRLNVFKIAWEELLELYANKQLDAHPKWFKDIYIDSTLIKNVNGTDCVGKNPCDRGRLGTKVSVICDDNFVPISYSHYGANVADSKTMLESYDAIACKLKIDDRCTNNLIGDKGYIAAVEEEILKSVGTNLLTLRLRCSAAKQRPFKVNAALKTQYLSLEQRKKLYKRHKIENVFCRMDKFRRIFYRNDRFISSFANWHYLAMCIMTMEGLTRVNADKNYSRKAMKSRYVPK
jgi:hypothetical protein